MGMFKHSQSPKIANLQSLQYLKKEVRNEVDFLLVDKHQSFLQIDFNTLGIKVSYKMILSLFIGTIKHSQSTQSNKFAVSLQYLKKEVKGEVHVLRADKHQSFFKLAFLFLMKMVRHVQSTQNRKSIIILQDLKKKSLAIAFLFYCGAKHLDILWGASHVRCDLFWRTSC